jgi:hypothetical protein
MRDWDEWIQKERAWRELTASDIESLLVGEDYDPDEKDDTDTDFSWYELDNYYYPPKGFVREGWTLRVTLLDSYGGEGEGEEVAKTVGVAWVDEYGDSCGTRYFQKPGHYQSYDGTYYDGEIFEVTPERARVTVWRRK